MVKKIARKIIRKITPTAEEPMGEEHHGKPGVLEQERRRLGELGDQPDPAAESSRAAMSRRMWDVEE